LGDPPLTDAGRAQARALGERHAAARFDVCFASPLARAAETARLLLAGRDVEIRTHACLAEGSAGELDGLSTAEAFRRFPEFYRLGRTVLARLAASGWTAPGGETRAQFLARAKLAQALVSEPLFHESTRALVVSHGGLLAYLVALLVGHEPRDEATIGFDFCGVARVTAYREEPAFGPFAMLRFGTD
ncbi:MAG: histidine phosphatase family protein, partial [Solirubrobacteraceae bacterium]